MRVFSARGTIVIEWASGVGEVIDGRCDKKQSRADMNEEVHTPFRTVLFFCVVVSASHTTTSFPK